MNLNTGIFLLVITCGMAVSIVFKKLTPAAAITGGLLSCLIYKGSGFSGMMMMAAFFLLAVLATSWKHHQKLAAGLAEPRKGMRTAAQVFANAGAAALVGLAAIIFRQLKPDVPLLIAACFAAATADTVSSELGNVYGKRFYRILSFQKGLKGNNGVVSIEGTIAGLAGSALIAFIYTLWWGWDINFLWILVAGTVGNVADSVLGELLENRGIINNNVVNFLNTCSSVVFVLFFKIIS